MIHVVAAIILQKNKVLLALRPDDKHQGGKWEFPGGKKEAGESSEQALIRECEEELNITLKAPELFDRVEFDYGDKQVSIEFLVSRGFDGEPKGNEGQEVRWFELNDIAELDFPKANKAVVKKLLANS
ncbi:8-oxo-dGTP diphosphatase MutT [Pleionea sp. CnH1-48]|uniref:8-oxo-dGTP diphosphatase MutT n=1 Tax=Pleionea sp. CnH1-48 TaxID=2954494 RepID=UPI0020980DDF|nr:8-oxo-dGTP diphosphatase MutT [Pleionea sp. CnH1-48]MCO7223982.1 8-oxo-dGTP diphosphatase MutT [Pleionea sp. CnH1-48]